MPCPPLRRVSTPGSVLFALWMLTLGGCAGGDPVDPGMGTGVGLRPQAGAETDTAWQGDRSNAPERTELTARTPEEWDRLWARAGVPAPIPLPGDQIAVALFLGPRTGGGYAVSLDPAILKDGAMVVPYHESVPGPDDSAAPPTPSPFAIRLIDAQAQSVTFVLAP